LSLFTDVSVSVSVSLTAATVLQLLSKIFNGKGSFEDTLSVLGFGVGVATLNTILHYLTDAFFGFIGVIKLPDTFWLSLLWILVILQFCVELF
jgi:hypothetical protein